MAMKKGERGVSRAERTHSLEEKTEVIAGAYQLTGPHWPFPDLLPWNTQKSKEQRYAHKCAYYVIYSWIISFFFCSEKPMKAGGGVIYHQVNIFFRFHCEATHLCPTKSTLKLMELPLGSVEVLMAMDNCDHALWSTTRKDTKPSKEQAVS